jgi:hypothetical protein
MENLLEGITQDMVNDAISKYGEDKVKQGQIPIDDEGTSYKNVLTKTPDLSVLSQYQRTEKSDWRKAHEILIRGVIIESKEELDRICKDTGLFLGALDVAVDRIPRRKGIVKNL